MDTPTPRSIVRPGVDLKCVPSERAEPPVEIGEHCGTRFMPLAPAGVLEGLVVGIHNLIRLDHTM
jgi:hypothetical protein